ncbi:MAG: histidinol-phosphatase HisJ family protein [Anaerolineae bacterium]|jgi:histidinol-phosphatase (PHP family)
MKRYKQDYHVHTEFSDDSEAKMAAACQAAVERGIDEIAFTDHLDFKLDGSTAYYRPAAYLAAIRQCRQRYEGQLTVLAGVEVGEPHLFPAETEAAIACDDFDIVLGSAHYASGMQAAWLEDYFEQPLSVAYESYLQQVADLSAKGDFDVLAHLDLVKRDARIFGRSYDGPGPYADLIRTALRSLVERGKGIELNTSPLRLGQGDPSPSSQILRWYRELGGEILTLGSDAHSPGAVGSHLDVAIDVAKAAGFTHLATFRKRQIDWAEI